MPTVAKPLIEGKTAESSAREADVSLPDKYTAKHCIARVSGYEKRIATEYQLEILKAFAKCGTGYVKQSDIDAVLNESLLDPPDLGTIRHTMRAFADDPDWGPFIKWNPEAHGWKRFGVWIVKL